MRIVQHDAAIHVSAAPAILLIHTPQIVDGRPSAVRGACIIPVKVSEHVVVVPFFGTLRIDKTGPDPGLFIKDGNIVSDQKGGAGDPLGRVINVTPKVVIDNAPACIRLTIVNCCVIDDPGDIITEPDAAHVVLINQVVLYDALGVPHVNAPAKVTPTVVVDLVPFDV